ncbi:MAG: VanZ family protein [Planctomycetes bacterium]|nr:VanZ family protein [Planctomycetota bacterium]
MDERPILSTRQYGWLTLAFVLFVFYGSLVPLHFRALPLEKACDKYVHVMSQPVRVSERSDWLANILLFVPLGFIAMGWRCVDRPDQFLGPILTILPACGLLSGLIEFIQIWFPPRHTNINDVVAETFGGTIGIGIWLAIGQNVTDYVRQFWSQHAVHNWSVRLIPGYLILLVLIHGMPFDLTISPSSLKRKYLEHMILPVPFTVPGTEPLDLVKKGLINIAWFLPAGVLLASLPPWFAYRTRGAGRIWLVGLALAGTIEMMQLFVLSRYFDTTDIITGSLAVLAGWRIMRAWQEHRETSVNAVRFPAGLRAGLLLFWVLALVFIHWEPFDFQFGKEFLDQRWHDLSFVPFADYYAGNYLYSFNEIIQKTLLFVPFGLFLGSAGATRADARLVVSAAFVFALVLEVGQLFLHHHNPGISDMIIEPFGAWLGCLAASRLRVLSDTQALGRGFRTPGISL